MITLTQIIQSFNGALDFMPPSSWLQGRTTYGGLTAALALQTVLNEYGNALPPLKSAQISFIGPAIGPLTFKTQLLRQGRSSTFISVDCYSKSEICLRVVFLFSAPRQHQIDHDYYTSPHVNPPETYKRLNVDKDKPASLANFDLRPVTSTLPMSCASYPELLAWVRHVDASNIDPTVALLALADGLPPAAISTIKMMIPFSSMTWMVNLPTQARNSKWHLMRSISQHAQNGYSYQTMEIWDENSNIVMTGSQTVAVFG